MRYEKWAMESLKRGRVPTEMDASFCTQVWGFRRWGWVVQLRRGRVNMFSILNWVVATQIFFISPQTLGKMNPFWRAYVSNGLKPPASQESKSIFTLWCFFNIFVRIYYWKSHVLIGKSKAGISKTTSYLCPGSIDGMLTPQKPPHTHPKVYAFSIWKFLLIAGKSMIYSDPFIIICVTSCSLWCFKVVVQYLNSFAATGPRKTTCIGKWS